MISKLLSYIITGFIIGHLILVKLLKLQTNNYLSGIIGICFLEILIIIPILGAIVTIISIALGLSIIWNLIKIKE